ncbi:TraI domain-containing protein [Xenorhabdus sp. Flor]|uniref:TraI domain-containing protein n=1 Tax=Xenorhabdus cabanillasii TaxID=351673 RepID=UPI001993DB43|nr:TraI domain-containing protein [Xenorhabdus sp. Flor]MBD2813968.1 TraI domain-containing protein [Xenorhabdus sp. Flor]
MKMFKRWLNRNSDSDVSGGNKSKNENRIAPDGYFLPKKSYDLLNTELRQNCLQQLWENVSLSKLQYQEFFLAPLQQCAERVQNLPAFKQGAFAQEGGLLDLTLLTMVYSVRLSKKKLLPTGALPEEQASQSSTWNAVVFYASMLHWLPLMGQFDGEYIDQCCWMPGIVTPNKAYRFRFKPDSSNIEELRSVSGALMSYTLLPEKAIYWLSETPVALQALMHCVAGKWGGGRDVSNLIDEAVSKLPNISASQIITPKLQNESNDNLGEILDIPNLKDSENISDTPSISPETNIKNKINEIQEKIQDIDIISLGSAFNKVSSQAEELSGTVETISTVSIEEPINDDLKAVMSLLDIKEDIVAEANCTDNLLLDNVFEHQSEHKITSSESKVCDSSLKGNKAIEIIEKDVILKGIEDVSVEEGYIKMERQEQGEDVSLKVKFWEWLKQGLQAEEIEYNTANAKVHCVAGFLFLQTPAIFFLFLRQHPELAVDHKKPLSAFESLSVHRVEKKGNKRKRHYTCKIYPIPINEETRKNNKFIRASGYLVKLSLIFVKNPPPDSSFVDFTSE